MTQIQMNQMVPPVKSPVLPPFSSPALIPLCFPSLSTSEEGRSVYFLPIRDISLVSFLVSFFLFSGCGRNYADFGRDFFEMKSAPGGSPKPPGAVRKGDSSSRGTAPAYSTVETCRQTAAAASHLLAQGMRSRLQSVTLEPTLLPGPRMPPAGVALAGRQTTAGTPAAAAESRTACGSRGEASTRPGGPSTSRRCCRCRADG